MAAEATNRTARRRSGNSPGTWSPGCKFCEGAELCGQLEAAQAKARQQLKQLASKGDSKNAKILAREVVRSNKQKDRLHVSKARLGSIHNQLAQQLGVHVYYLLSFCGSFLWLQQ